MENKQISSAQFGKGSSSGSELLFIDEAIDPVITSYLDEITEEQWLSLAYSHTDTDTIRLLSGLCLGMVEAITRFILDSVVPRVQRRMQQLESSNTSITMNEIDVPKMDWSYYFVTEEAMQHRIGDTLHVSFGVEMGVVEERSHNSDKLLELVAAEVTRRVNHTLAKITQSPSVPPSDQSAGPDISLESLVDDMVYHTAQILHRCFWRRNPPEEGSQDSDFIEFSGPDEVTDVEEFNAEDAESICSSSERSVLSQFSGPEEITDTVELIDVAIEPVIITYLHKLTAEQWELLATNYTDTDTIRLLSGLCEDMVKEITYMVLKDVLRQVRAKRRALESSNTSITMNKTYAPETDWSYYIMTEEDIRLWIGDSLHVCLGAVMGVVEERSHISNKLLELVAAEVTRRVNRSLPAITQSPSVSPSHQSAGSDISRQSVLGDMVYHTAQILHRCFWRKKRPVEGSQDSDFSEFSGPDEVTDVEEFKAEDAESICSSSEGSVLYEFSGPDEVTDVEEFKAEDAESICSSSDGSVLSFQIIEASPSPAVDASQRENFSGQKSTGRTSSFVKKVRRFFSRNTARVNPACEVVQLENGSTPPPPKKKKRPAITRMFSSLARILRKPFTSCS